MRFKRATPSYRLICMVLAAVLLLALAVPGLAEHQWSDRIRSFERIDPVYDEAVELGTAQESLHLPDTLRAIVDIPEELDVTTFVQAAPEADTSDGSTSFDYYWYGYVAPQDADALVEAGERPSTPSTTQTGSWRTGCMAPSRAAKISGLPVTRRATSPVRCWTSR